MPFLDKNLFTYTWAPNDIASNGDRIAVATGTVVRHLNMSTGASASVALSVAANSLAFINATEVICFSNSVTAPRRVDLSANTSTALTAVGTTRFARKHQTTAGNTTTNIVISVGSGTNQLLKVDSSFTTSTLAPVAGKSFTTIIRKPATNNWLIGTIDGIVYEIDSAGVVQKTISLAQSPAVAGGTFAVQVVSMSMSGDILLVGCTSGLLYLIDYPSGATTNIFSFGREQASPYGASVSNIENNLFAFTSADSASGQGTMALFDISSGYPVMLEDKLLLFAQAIGPIINTTHNLIVVGGNTAFSAIKTASFTSPTISTRAQDPVGSDIAHRMMRMKHDKYGQWHVDSDANYSSSETAVTAHLPNCGYIDLSLIGTQFASEKFDVREASS